MKATRLIKPTAFFVFVLAFCAMFVFNICALNGSSDKNSENNRLTDGIYNIINVESGKYLEVFDKAKDEEGRMFFADKSYREGQKFLVRSQDDGSFVIYPQNDGGAYALCSPRDIMDNECITKTDKITHLNEFDIECLSAENNIYSIKPAHISDTRLVLGISTVEVKNKSNLAGITLGNGSDSQKWEFVKVSSEQISLSSSYCNVRLNGTYMLHATFSPSYLIANMIWKSENEEIATVSPDGNITGISKGETVVTVSCGEITASCNVVVTDVLAYTWYASTIMSTADGTPHLCPICI